jgi:hypothetical protein
MLLDPQWQSLARFVKIDLHSGETPRGLLSAAIASSGPAASSKRISLSFILLVVPANRKDLVLENFPVLLPDIQV